MNFQPIEQRKKIRTNVLLKGNPPNISYDYFLKLKEISEKVIKKGQTEDVNPSDIGMLINLASLSENEIHNIYLKYGKEGLSKLLFLLTRHKKEEFKHFYDIISGEFILPELYKEGEEEELKLDNDNILQNERVKDFNTNIVQPSLSRKIYNPGRHHGYLVYGVGDLRS